MNNPEDGSQFQLRRIATSRQETSIRRYRVRIPGLLSRNPYSVISKKSWGFTLIEVLVALTIASVVLAALYSTFFLSRRAIDALDESLLKLQESRAVMDTIKREVESAYYSNEKTYTTFKLDDRDFYGKHASQMHFTSFSNLIPGLSKISYLVVQNEGRLTLIKKLSSAYSKSADSGTELIEDLDSFTVEARYNDKWVKTWDSDLSKNMPDEIKVTIKVVLKRQDAPAGDNGLPTLFTFTDIISPKIGKTI